MGHESKFSSCQRFMARMFRIIAAVPSSGVRPDGPWTRSASKPPENARNGYM